MSKKSILRSVAMLTVAGVVAIGVSVARSEDKPKAEAPKMDAAMMEAFMKAAQPGAEHERLKQFAGEWTAETQSWQPDGSVCGTGKGIMQNKMVLGDRYLQMSFEGEMNSPMGKMPYHGMGLAGYDNAKKKYINLWIDDMGTGMMTSEGTCEGNVMTADGSYTDPISGKAMKVKEISTFVDKDHHKYELHMEGPDGKLFKTMEITYTRKA